MSKNRTPIPKRLKEARNSAKISQRALGIAAGIDPGSASARVNHYEQGRHQPTFTMMQKFGIILGKPTAFFYAEDDELAKMIDIEGRRLREKAFEKQEGKEDVIDLSKGVEIPKRKRPAPIPPP